jgi:carboxyl-terminal processing protease
MINMSSKTRESFSIALLALSIGIQIAAPLSVEANVPSRSNRAGIVAKLQQSSILVAKNNDDDDEDDDDDDDDKDRHRREEKEKQKDATVETDKEIGAYTDPNSTTKTDTSVENKPVESVSPASVDPGSTPNPTVAAPSWNDATEKRDSEVQSSKPSQKIENQNSDKKDSRQGKGSERKLDNEKPTKNSSKSKKSTDKEIPVAKAALSGKPPEGLPPSFYVDLAFNQKVIDKVDALVNKRLYSKKLAQTAWKDGLQKNREAILNSKSLRDLSISMGAAIGELKSSHCNFVTANDEMFHFLHALFSDFNKKMSKGKIDYVGFVTGGAPFEDDQVRYILDSGPAAKGGLRIGDHVLKVNGHPYVGYLNFLDTAGKNTVLTVNRNGESKSITIKPEKDDLYTAYCDAMKKSVRIEQEGNKKIGYVHVWSGGKRSFEALDEIMEDKLGTTDGLIFDLRDGYGGNSLNDLDRFYRPAKAYPNFETVDRNGKKNIARYFYDKPIVAIINGGSRSGKELLSFSFKRTGRAKLVGTNTAGAVLAGSLFKVDDKASLYLAVLDGTVDGTRLEGVGVAPDLVVDNASHDQVGYEKQFAVAKETLLELIKK